MNRRSIISAKKRLPSTRLIFPIGLVGLWMGCNQIADIQEGKPYPDACLTVADCTAGEPECRSTTCENERCVYVDVPEGTRLSDTRQTVGDCQQLECDGKGQARVATVELDVPDDNEACTKDECVGTQGRHVNLPWVPCYSGPVGTDLFGNCKLGIQACADGKPIGACVGERIPKAETCLTILDDDCDGSVNEEGAGCVCVPGSVGNCYPGNEETLAYGSCAPGVQLCNALGTAYESCTGFVGPVEEVCDSGQVDDDCDGRSNESGANCICGDGFVSGTEACDDGNMVDGDNCSNQCQIPGCGDGQKSITEECDDGNGDNLDACTNQCQNAKCGDGFVHLGVEVCDDGNTNETDACSAQCKIPGCGDGTKNGNEECDDGNTSNTDNCTTQCLNAKCGDTFIQTGVEECDDGNTNNGDLCSAQCQVTICGDGMVVGAEVCDDGNGIANDGCTNCIVDPGFGCTPTSPSMCSPKPSCLGLPKNCGPMQNEDCCISPVVTGGTYNRLNNAMYPATVSDFRLDRFEVTVGRFRKFVEAYPASKPLTGQGTLPGVAGSGWNANWNLNLPAVQNDLRTEISCGATPMWTDTPGVNETKPMNCVSWYEAFAFCLWDGGNLPTLAQWSYAATGGNEQRAYPWGNAAPSSSLAVYECITDGSGPGSCSLNDILNVGSRPAGNGKWMQADLGGSAQEWSFDGSGVILTPCMDCAQVVGSQRGVHGGSWAGQEAWLQNLSLPDRTPDTRSDHHGVRCARPL